MAFPVVANSVTNNDTTGTSHTVGLPTGIAAGDLIIVIFASDGAPTITWPSGWNQAANNLIATTTSTDVTMAAKQRVADGTEGGTNITVTTSVSEWTAWVTLRITGWHGTTAAEAGTATGSSATANPPSLNPANWDVEDTLWIACACNDTGGTDNDDITAHPTNYTGIGIALATTNAGGVCLAASRRNNAAASEDPGTYTAPTTEAWVAGTIGIRPSGVVSGTAALTVPQPSIAASGTVASDISGTAALAVAQPSVAASGTVTATVTGTAVLTVPAPSVAASGTVTAPSVTGTAALAVPAPMITASGTAPYAGPAPGGGGRSRHRAVVHRYPPRRQRSFDPADVSIVDVYAGVTATAVPAPRIRASGDVISPAELAADDRMLADMALEDDDLAFALEMAATWP